MDEAPNREIKKCLVHDLSFLLVLCVRGGQDVCFTGAGPGLISGGFAPDGFQSLLHVEVQCSLVKF